MEDVISFLESQPEVQKISVPAHTVICEYGDTCQNLVVLKSGKVKIFRVGEDGRRFTLYQIHSGESCVLTASCLLNNKSFPAIAITEEDSEGYVVSSHLLRQWLSTKPDWQAFIFDLLSQRMGDLIEKVDHLAFDTLETRLMQWLGGFERGAGIPITHQALAEEMASSREVVSRLLKKLEQKGIVELHRGYIRRM